MAPEVVLREAEGLLRAGDPLAAERKLAVLWADTRNAPGAALHMLGLIRIAQKRHADAERFLRRAAASEPGVARHNAALGDLFAQVGAHAPAIEAYRATLAVDPGYPRARLALARTLLAAGKSSEAEPELRRLLIEAPNADVWDLLARALRQQEKLEQSVAAADEALKLAPGHTAAAHGRATALARIGRNDEAIAVFDELIARGVEAPAVWLQRGVALLNQTRHAEAEAAFADGVKRWPGDAHLHDALAHTRWMRGAGADFAREFEAALMRQPEITPLRLACADLLRRADQRGRAETLLREGLARSPDDLGLQMSLGVLLDEVDRTSEGLPLLQSALARAPSALNIRGGVVNALLRLGRGDEALREIAPSRAAEPLNQEWICYEGMALRQLGDARYNELCDYDLMVQAYELPTPPGYSSLAEFNAALRESLLRLHVLETHPLDQSLRLGSQTTRSLLTIGDPVIQAYLAALRDPIMAYTDLMRDPNHPWSGRKTGGYRLSGAWSVKLKPHGYHINHYHPAGWISSAYYVSVPDVAQGGGQEGWIKFGEARWPTPGITTEKVVQPQVGRLVLFPSYMWHGTIPFSEGERITAPFDALPA
jgi:predicted Zn-dependent protease